MREAFEEWSPQRHAQVELDHVNSIIAEYQRRGFTLTVRQLYYQFVARDLTKNTLRDYKRIANVIKRGRIAGLVDWEMIEDRTRNLCAPQHWNDPASIVATAAESYQEDLWRQQTYQPEVWIEKDALLGIITDVCQRYRVPYMSCRGNGSISLQYEAARRLTATGRRPLILYLGDHDPTGLDMIRDHREKLALFAREHVEVRPIALTFEQVQRFEPPPNFVKEGDTRTSGYVDRFGTEECWELDALDPGVINDLIEDSIKGLLDEAAWKKAARAEERNRRLLQRVSEPPTWTKVEKLVRR